MLKKGGQKVETIKLNPVDPWWDRVTKTYCSCCKSLQPVYHYQGHFICKKCNNATSFYIPVPGFQMPTQPVTWNKNATALITVKCEMNDILEKSL